MSNWPANVLIIGETGSGDTELLFRGLQGILADHHIQVVDANHFDPRVFDNTEPVMLFYILDELQASTRPSDRHMRNMSPNKGIQVIWQLVEAGHAIHIALTRDRMYEALERHTAIDTMALCLSGTSGVWEVSSDLLDQRAGRNPDFRDLRWAWQAKRVVVYGRVARQLYDFQSMILGDWPTVVTGLDGDQSAVEESHAERCFQLSAGIAALGLEDLRLESHDDYRNLDNIVERLRALQDITGCAMGKTMYRKYLGYLERGWNERVPSYDKKRRNEMPLWSRADGFPPYVPMIKGCPPLDTTELLYQGFRDLGFDRGWDSSSEPQFATVKT